MLAKAGKSLLSVPHIDETFRVQGFLAVDFRRRQRSRVFLGEFVSSGVVKDDRAIGSGDFDFEARGGEGDELVVVSEEREVGFGPGFFDDEIVGALWNVSFEGVDDVDDGVRADLKPQESRLENQHGAVRLRADGLNGIKGYPLRDHGCGG